MAWSRLSLIAAAALSWAVPAHAGEDPLNSPIWPEIRAQVLGSGPVEYDSRVMVQAPASAEDSGQVPVSVRVQGLPGIKTIVVLADYNPIPRILAFHPGKAENFIGTRFKINMATPVRAAAQTADGVWHVGGTWVDAAGGGCSQPSIASANPEWQSRLGEIAARAWPHAGGTSRVRFRVLHPMDTGLAGNIPAFYVDQAVLTSAQGEELARVELSEPVSENPVLSLDLPGRPPFGLKLHDNSGNEFNARIP